MNNITVAIGGSTYAGSYVFGYVLRDQLADIKQYINWEINELALQKPADLKVYIQANDVKVGVNMVKNFSIVSIDQEINFYYDKVMPTSKLAHVIIPSFYPETENVNENGIKYLITLIRDMVNQV